MIYKASYFSKNKRPFSYNFSIKLKYIDYFSHSQKCAFEYAARKWVEIIVGGLSTIEIDGELTNGIIINVSSPHIDGRSKVLGQAYPVSLRKDSYLPAVSIMEFDADDLGFMEDEGNLENVVLHEMGHALGFGTLWESFRLLLNEDTDNPVFVGLNAMRIFSKMLGSERPVPVPVENIGRQGVRICHWRESIFHDEVMTTIPSSQKYPISLLTIASLADLGYRVNFLAGDTYEMFS